MKKKKLDESKAKQAGIVIVLFIRYQLTAQLFLGKLTPASTYSYGNGVVVYVVIQRKKPRQRLANLTLSR